MVDAWDWEVPLLGKTSFFWRTILLPWKSLVEDDDNENDDAFDLSFREQKEPDLLKLQVLGKTEIWLLWWWWFWCHEETRFVLLKTSAMEKFSLTIFHPNKQNSLHPENPGKKKKNWKLIFLWWEREREVVGFGQLSSFKLSYFWRRKWIRDEEKCFI